MTSVLLDGKKPYAVVLDDWDGIAESSPALNRLREVASVTVLGNCDDSQVVESAADAHIIVPIRERRLITGELLAQLPCLRHIAQTGGSATHIDLDTVRRMGVEVSTTPGASASSVAELTIALMIVAERDIARAHARLKSGRWERELGRQLKGSTLGVVGWGATGSHVGKLGLAIGMNLLVHSRRSAVGGVVDGHPNVSLDDLFELSDIVSLHVELSDDTHGMITRSHLRRLGPDGLLVNTARAALVSRIDLLETLNSGELGSAALDVFHTEPPEAGDAIVNHPSVVATPHLGWRTDAVMEAYLESAVDNIMAWLTRNTTEGN